MAAAGAMVGSMPGGSSTMASVTRVLPVCACAAHGHAGHGGEGEGDALQGFHLAASGRQGLDRVRMLPHRSAATYVCQRGRGKAASRRRV